MNIYMDITFINKTSPIHHLSYVTGITESHILHILLRHRLHHCSHLFQIFLLYEKTFKLSKLFRKQVNPWINLYLDLFVYRYRKIINIQVSPCNLHTK